VWSLLNPLVFLAVFSFVVEVFSNPVPDFPVFLLSGLLAWNLVANALQAGSRSVIDNANLVKKMSFPREILPLAAIGVALFDFVLQAMVLGIFIVVSGHGLPLPALWLYPLSLLTLLLFTGAMTLWVAALNVRYRDVGHLLNLGLLVWFWLTPIVYQAYLVQRELAGVSIGLDAWVAYLLNPMATIVMGFQWALYGQPAPPADPVLPTVSLAWQAGMLGLFLVVSAAMFLLAWRTFFRRSGDFAEEL
jgi:ABC-2 type transport system permease protein